MREGSINKIEPLTGTFWFTSRRVEGHPFSLTIYIDKQSHVRLSACCEHKRTVGSRLGQGSFTLVGLEGGQVDSLHCTVLT